MTANLTRFWNFQHHPDFIALFVERNIIHEATDQRLYFRVGNSLDQLLERCRRDCEQLEACACAEEDDDQQTVQEGI